MLGVYVPPALPPPFEGPLALRQVLLLTDEYGDIRGANVTCTLKFVLPKYELRSQLRSCGGTGFFFTTCSQQCNFFLIVSMRSISIFSTIITFTLFLCSLLPSSSIIIFFVNFLFWVFLCLVIDFGLIYCLLLVVYCLFFLFIACLSIVHDFCL